MLTDDCATYLRSIIQEPDTTFVTDAMLAVWLQQAYREFRTLVEMIRPDYYAETVNITPSGTSYDLSTGAVIILGSGVLTNPRLQRIITIQTSDTNGYPDVWRGVTALRALYTGYYTNARQYFLQDTTLHFDTEATQTLTIVYSAVDEIAWAANLGAPGVFIDDLDAYHDLIALKAAMHYQVSDASQSPALEAQLLRRTEDLRDFMRMQRAQDDANISREDDYYQ